MTKPTHWPKHGGWCYNFGVVPLDEIGAIAVSELTLDQRVAVLEQEVARLSNLQQSERRPQEKNWRSTLGMFAGDAIMKEIIEEGRKIREQDREQTRG